HRYVKEPSAFSHVLDFGGATGRFSRHVVLRYPSAIATIAELSLNHVEWVNQHFGNNVRGVKVSPYPHLPLADNSASLCTAYSVFTHIDAYETGWLVEINRILKPGGYAFISVNAEGTWTALGESPVFLERVKKSPTFLEHYSISSPLPERHLIF